VLLLLVAGAHGQSSNVLEEIIVTATRVETNLQQTPMSIQAFSAEDLELAGIDRGADLGIMVPNAVMNSGFNGELVPSMVIRGVPSVGLYFDGFFMNSSGFLQSSFVELERVEVLRGPQGTYFGRDSNGGAILTISRPPADSFGVSFGIEAGEFDHRAVRLAVDAPVNDRLLTKWTAASDRNDGFLRSQTASFAAGDSDDSLLRGDVLWIPTDSLSLRFTANRERRRSTDARIVRVTDPEHPALVAYNVLAGNPDYLAQARAIDPAFPDSPFPLDGDRFTAESHEPGYPGGTLGLWETRSDQPGPTTISDVDLVTLTTNWDFAPSWSLEWLLATQQGDFQLINKNDASEFDFSTGANLSHERISSQEMHIEGNLFNGRLRTLFGLWYLERDSKMRSYIWDKWEFAIPSAGPGRPASNLLAVDYVRAWSALVANEAVANIGPGAADVLSELSRREDAVFGEFEFSLADRLALTLGYRFTSSPRGGGSIYLPASAFRPAEPGTFADGYPYEFGLVVNESELNDLGTESTPRVALSYQFTDSIYVYGSYAEGFTSGDVFVDRDVPEPIILDPEVVRTREIGMRADLIRDRLRLNATLFDSDWDGLRVGRQLIDSETGEPLPRLVPSSGGRGALSGFELEVLYLPGDRWEVDFALGLLDSEYLELSDPDPRDPNGDTGLQPGIPFAYAPDVSFTLGLRYRLPLASGDSMLFAANYGWMDDYERNPQRQFQIKNPDGSTKREPAYGLLNARMIYSPAEHGWSVALFGTNLTNEWYVNGGNNFDFRFGLDRATIGRPREVGIAFDFEM